MTVWYGEPEVDESQRSIWVEQEHDYGWDRVMVHVDDYDRVVLQNKRGQVIEIPTQWVPSIVDWLARTVTGQEMQS